MGRSNPSGSRLHYLSHLEDCRKVSSLGVTAALSLLSEVCKSLEENPQVDQGLISWGDNIKADLEYLQKELDTFKGEMEDLGSMVSKLGVVFQQGKANIVGS
jgi:hypothetical protein